MKSLRNLGYLLLVLSILLGYSVEKFEYINPNIIIFSSFTLCLFSIYLLILSKPKEK